MSSNLLIPLLAGLALVLVGALFFMLRRQAGQLAELCDELAQRDRQLELLQESLQGVGRKLLEQERRIARLGSAAPAAASGSSADSSEIIRALEAGKTVAEIARETGLEEVEISLLRQIHEATRSPA